MSVQTLNPAGYSLVLDCRHNRLRQAILSHQPRPRLIAPASTPQEPPESPKSMSIEEFRNLLRGVFYSSLAVSKVVLLTLGVDLLLTIV